MIGRLGAWELLPVEQVAQVGSPPQGDRTRRALSVEFLGTATECEGCGCVVTDENRVTPGSVLAAMSTAGGAEKWFRTPTRSSGFVAILVYFTVNRPKFRLISPFWRPLPWWMQGPRPR